MSSDRSVPYSPLSLPYLVAPDNLLLEYGSLGSHHFYRLLDFETETTMALMKLVPETVHTHNYLTIKKINVVKIRRGYGSFLYKTAIMNSDIPVLSDKTQTLPGSVNVWQGLHSNWHSQKKEIKILNSRNGQIIPFSPTIPTYEIWGYDEEILAEIKEDDDMLESMYEYNDISKMLFDFLSTHLVNIRDKKHIRLIGAKI